MNKIQNGDFSSGFDYWDNGVDGGYPYVMVFGVAKAASIPGSTDPRTSKMRQSFSVNDEVVAAKLTVWGKWICWTGEVDGYVRFKVELEKPDTSKVALLDETKTPPSAYGNLLDEEDITAHFDQYGNYKLRLICELASCFVNPEFYTSHGYYDNINLDMVVKKYKTVHEKLGSSGVLDDKASVSRSEIVGLSEAYSTEVTSPTFNYETASESFGLSESYSEILKRQRGVVEVVGLVEAAQAKRTRGNMETTYVLEDLTQWTEISRVTTPWIKIKTEIS